MPFAFLLLLLVESLAGPAVGRHDTNRFSNVSSAESSASDWSLEAEESVTYEAGKWLTYRESQSLLKMEGGVPVDCCPSVIEMVQPRGGINREGLYVDLSGGHNTQRFYEVSCRPGVEDKPCRFIDRKLHNQSKCVQMFSWTYAIVKAQDIATANSERTSYLPLLGREPGNGWNLDYIRVRSGCSCQLKPKPRKKRQNSGEKHKKSKMKHLSEERTSF